MGILNVDKPPGITSASAVARLRRSSGVKRVGHGGTLDPAATGVLPVFLGRSTVLADWLSRQGKSYRAEVRLGRGSDTDDAEGTLTSPSPPVDIDSAAVTRALEAFTGEVLQRPPAFSAVKVEGQRSYRRARRGDTTPPAPRPVRVDAIRLVDLQGAEDSPLLVLEVDCGPGFYVRSLARDLGVSLGTQAHLEHLRRTRVGCLEIDDATPLATLEEAGTELEAFLHPAAAALAGVFSIPYDEGAIEELRLGRSLPTAAPATEQAYACDVRGRVLAVGRVHDGRFHPHRLVEA